MAYFALLWKARTIEKYRLNYEKQKLISIRLCETQNPNKTFYQKIKLYNCNVKKKIFNKFQEWYPEGSTVHGFFYYSTTDQTFPNFVLKSIIGFVGGIILTYLFFMFFVFQLAISLVHATIMSSIIGVLLTLGLAFSYRIRCLVFLLIPQCFSRVGRYTLTCYALVLILTGPATNTLKNSEVLSESMACRQEQIKSSVGTINEYIQKPFNALKDSIQTLIDKVRQFAAKIRTMMTALNRLVITMAQTLQSTYFYLDSVTTTCNKKLGTPYEMCISAVSKGVQDCQASLGARYSSVCNVAYVAKLVCYTVQPLTHFCVFIEYFNSNIVGSVEKAMFYFSERMQSMLKLKVNFHHSYTFSSNSSRSASQVAAGVVTEIRRRADPLLTWLSWSSCVTSLFLVLIIFRAKHYQNMFETRSRFDNRYITKELRELDLKRMRQGRETILPLNGRERAKYITTTSFRIVETEKIHLSRSAIFMVITTFKLLIHIIADYSLYWVLTTIRYHGRFETPVQMGAHDPMAFVTGTGLLRRFFEALLRSIHKPLETPPPLPVSYLPDPNPPDLQRYAQIGVLILLLWFFAMFEPYGLRLRHVIMGMYRPERAKARALWLYNHIQRTRSGFMKFARRKLHRENKYSSEAKHTLEYWLNSHIPYACLRSLLGISPRDPACLLCCTIEYCNDCDTNLVRCNTLDCPGVFCVRCFADIGDLCTICLSPADYGDMSDISLEKGSSDEIDDEDCVYCSMRGTGTDFRPDDDDHGGLASHNATDYIRKAENKSNNAKKSNNREKRRHGGWKFTKKAKDQSKENVPLLDTDSDADDESFENDKASGRLIKTTLFTKERKHKSNKGKLKKDRYPKSGSRKIKCKFCFQNQDFCDCESHSLCLLKAEFRRALELATEKGLLRKKERNVKTEHVETQYPVFSKELGVQTSLYLIPKPTKTAICSTSEIEPLLEMPINYQSKRLRRPPWKRSSKNAEKSRSKIPCSSKYSIKCSKAHFLVHKTFRVTKPTKKLRSKCKLFFRQRRPGKTNFGKWFRSMAKRLRSRKLSFSKLGEGDYKNTGTKLSNNTNNSSKGKDEKCGESKEIEAKHVDENTSTINEETEIPNKETKRKNKSRIKLACKKYGDYLRGAKHVATPDATKIASNYKIEDTTPFDSEKFNFKRRKKLLRRDKSNSGQVKSKRDCENTRKYRISSYLSEQEWMKKRHTKKTAPQTSTDIDIQVAKYHPPEDTKAEELKLRTPKNNMKTILSPKLNSHNDLEMLDVVPRYLSENTIARSSINLQDTKKKLFNSMEVQASSSSSNFLSYTNELLAANASPRKPADSYKYSTTQTLDYDMTRSMDYYRSIGMKDFDENDEEAQTGFDMRKKREKESKSNMELDKQALPSTSFDHALVSDSICVINDYDEELPLFPSQSKFLRCESHTAAQKKTPKSKECHRKVGKQVSFHLGLPKILSPLATLYSCLFGKKRTINEDVELLRVDEGITVYPIVKSCACQNIYMENPNVKETIKTQPSRMDVGQSISHKELHDAEVNAVHPTCTCAIQSTIAKREACTFCTTKQRRISMVYEGATTARYINETAAPVKYRELFGTMHAECIKRKTNDGIERRYEPKDIHPVKPPMNSSKLSADISKKPKSKAGSRSKADMKSKALPKTKSYYKLKRRGSKPRSRHSSNSSDRSDSSDSGSRTATTVCSRATIRYENEMPRVSNKKHVDVVTKANRSTLTNTRRFADTSTGTSDWWSPLLEKKDKMFDLPRKEVRGKRNAGCQYTRNYAAAVDVPKATQYRAVSFKSQTQIIPSETPRHVEVLSPSRFLIESERYYNEICSPDLRQSVKHRDQHHPVQHHDGRGEVWLGDYRPKRVPKRSKECNTTRRLPSPRGRAQLRVNFEQACRAETSDQKRSPSDSRYSKYRSGVQRSKSANRPTIRDKDSVDLKRADNNLLRGCASSDHISLHCHCNSEDTTTGSC